MACLGLKRVTSVQVSEALKQMDTSESQSNSDMYSPSNLEAKQILYSSSKGSSKPYSSAQTFSQREINVLIEETLGSDEFSKNVLGTLVS